MEAYLAVGKIHLHQQSAITNELGHTHYAHDCSTQQAEHKADKWWTRFRRLCVALLLREESGRLPICLLYVLPVHEAAVQHTAYETEFEPAAIAIELGVTQHI